MGLSPLVYSESRRAKRNSIKWLVVGIKSPNQGVSPRPQSPRELNFFDAGRSKDRRLRSLSSPSFAHLISRDTKIGFIYDDWLPTFVADRHYDLSLPSILANKGRPHFLADYEPGSI